MKKIISLIVIIIIILFIIMKKVNVFAEPRHWFKRQIVIVGSEPPKT